MADPFGSPEGLRQYQPGTWPAPVGMELACGCTVRPGDAIGRNGHEIICEDHLYEQWEAERSGGHGGPF